MPTDGLGSVTVVYFGLFGFLFVRTKYLQDVLGYTPLQAGIRVAPLAVVLAGGAQLRPHLARRFGTKVVVTTGMVFLPARARADGASDDRPIEAALDTADAAAVLRA